MDQIWILDLIAIRFEYLLPRHALVFGGNLTERIAGDYRVKDFTPGRDIEVQNNVAGAHVGYIHPTIAV